MLLLRLALFVFTALHSAIAFPLSEQKGLFLLSYSGVIG